MAQGASGRPSPLLTPALQLGLWSLRWLAWLGSRAAEGKPRAAEASRCAEPAGLGAAAVRAHGAGGRCQETLGDGFQALSVLPKHPGGTGALGWGLPCPAQPPEQQRPGRSGGPPSGAGQGAPLGQPHNKLPDWSQGPMPYRGEGGAEHPVPAWPQHEHAGQHPGGTHCRSRFSWHLWSRTAGPSMLGCPGGPGEGAEDSTRASPRSQQLGPPPWSSFRGPRCCGGRGLPPPSPPVALPDGQEGKGARPPGVGVS